MKPKHINQIKELEDEGLEITIPIEMVYSYLVEFNFPTCERFDWEDNFHFDLKRCYHFSTLYFKNRKQLIEKLNKDMRKSKKLFILENIEDESIFFSQNTMRVIFIPKTKVFST